MSENSVNLSNDYVEMYKQHDHTMWEPLGVIMTDKTDKSTKDRQGRMTSKIKVP